MRWAVTGALSSLARAGNRLWQPWREFWFTPADPTPLAVMRILFGGMLFYTHLVWGLNLEGFFGPNGWQSETLVRMLQQDQFAWSFWWWVPGGMRLAVHLVSLGVLLLFMLGAWTPVTSVLAYLITISYAYRAPLANFGLDQMNAIAALYLAIGPSGAVLSLDRLWHRYRQRRRALAAGQQPTDLPVPYSRRANLALRLVQVHLCVIYLFACHSKLQGESWWNGEAIWQAVSNLEYQSVDLSWLAWYPWLVNLLTHATILWELTFWALVWRPLCRPVVLLFGVAIHLGIGAFMGMWTFGLAVIFLYVAFVPARTINAVLGVVTWPIAGAARKSGFDPARTEEAEAPPAMPEPAAIPTIASPSAARADAVPPRVTARAVPPNVAAVGFPVPAALAAGAIPSPPAGIPAEAPVAAVERNGRSRPPVLVLVESRLKRQTQIQEYLIKRGFRCFAAAELNQARSLLTVVDVDALVMTSTWFPEEEVRCFRDALIAGGPALPASLFFLSGANAADAQRLEDHSRHRLVRGSVSLHELRLLLLDVLGPDWAWLRSEQSRSGQFQSKQSRARQSGPPESGSDRPREKTPPQPPAPSPENGRGAREPRARESLADSDVESPVHVTAAEAADDVPAAQPPAGPVPVPPREVIRENGART